MSPDAAQIGDTRASGGAVTDTHVSVAAAAGARVACAEARVATAEAESAKWRGYAKAWVRLCSEQARDALKTRMICEMSGEALSRGVHRGVRRGAVTVARVRGARRIAHHACGGEEEKEEGKQGVFQAHVSWGGAK